LGDIGKLFLAAIAIDLIYQVYVLRWFHPGQALIVAIILAFPAYIVLRGLTNRIARRTIRRGDE
jgi:hypothetical protein